MNGMMSEFQVVNNSLSMVAGIHGGTNSGTSALHCTVRCL